MGVNKFMIGEGINDVLVDHRWCEVNDVSVDYRGCEVYDLSVDYRGCEVKLMIGEGEK